MLKGTKMHPSKDKWDQLGKGMFEELLCCQYSVPSIRAQLSVHYPSAVVTHKKKGKKSFKT